MKTNTEKEEEFVLISLFGVGCNNFSKRGNWELFLSIMKEPKK